VKIAVDSYCRLDGTVNKSVFTSDFNILERIPFKIFEWGMKTRRELR